MSLQQFLNTFNNIDASNYYVIDPVNFFTVDVKFDTEMKLPVEDLSPFIQGINLPDFTVAQDAVTETLVGTMQMHKMFLTPTSQTFTMTLINTKAPIIENWIYPWLREVTSPNWNYANVPFTKAKFTIDLSSHANIKYVLNGVRPTNLKTIQPTHELGGVTRDVTFTFDYMYVIADENMIEPGFGSQIKTLARNLVSKAGKTIGL